MAGEAVEMSEEEGAFEAFVCPLTKQVMRDPVTIETGQTFEREAILKWFRECRDNGRRPTCPLTQRELRDTEVSPSVALRSVIHEWRARNEEKDLDRACASLVGDGGFGFAGHAGDEEEEESALRALVHVSQICQRSAASKDLVRRRGVLRAVAEMLKSGSRRLRLKSLQVLRVLVEDNDDNKEELGKGDTIRTIIKFLSNEHVQERELAVSLLHELSGHEPTCERIGAVYGAILLLVGMGSSKSESAVAVDKAESTLRNLDRFDANVKQMADNGRLQPLLTRLLRGEPDTRVAMADYLGELALANDDKAAVAEQAGPLLVGMLRTGATPAKEATLKALREISSSEASAKLLLQRAGVLPPLVNDVLFSTGHLPMKLKELAATILANLVASGADFRSIPLDDDEDDDGGGGGRGRRRTLLSEDVVHSQLHLISNTGPAIGCRLLSVLAGLTSSRATVADVVAAVKSSGATISLIQFIEAAHRDIRVESLKLLRNLAPYMGAELADALGGSLSSLLRVISSDGGGVTEEQAAAVGLLGDLPEGDSSLTRQLFDLGAFRALAPKLAELRRGTIRGGNRYVTPLTEGVVKVMYRVTCALEEDAEYVEFAREAGLAPLFVELLHTNGMDTVQLYSAMALEKLSLQSSHLTAIPAPPSPPAGFGCTCLGRRPAAAAVPAGVCRVHGGFCSLRETFCLAQADGGKAVERLVACLDHLDGRVVEAALAALSTLVCDGVDAREGVVVLGEADGLRPVVDIMVESRTEALQRRAVWAVERILRVEEIAGEVAADQTVASALVEAYRNGDPRTRQTAERALRHLDRIPNFSAAFQSKRS
uniref:RING-type E3 ubiquitin transferase n=1 Tax=Oryza meridionalis TaxID=40149 RepID=A0A0E0D461_9ORYZ